MTKGPTGRNGHLSIIAHTLTCQGISCMYVHQIKIHSGIKKSLNMVMTTPIPYPKSCSLLTYFNRASAFTLEKSYTLCMIIQVSQSYNNIYVHEIFKSKCHYA